MHIIRWAREQETAGDRLPRGTPVPPASDATERLIVERMQRRIFAAKRAETDDEAAHTGGAALNYPGLVYAAYNPAYPPEGRQGRPGMATSPRRLLSNRWDSAITYRTFDMRIANTFAGADDDTPAPAPMSPTPRPVPPLGLHPTHTVAVDATDEPVSVTGLAGLLATLPAASPAAAGLAYKQRLVDDTCLSYERPPRWQLR